MALAAPVARAILNLAALTVSAITGVLGGDNVKRTEFVKAFLENARREYPDYNVVLIHTRHTVSGEYVHQHVELPISLGRTIGYEVYFSLRGKPFTLTKQGDGGWINWGYDGWFTRSGDTITAT